MSAHVKALYILAALVLIFIPYSMAKPKYVECDDSLECSVGHCCMLGMGKFSIPRCVPLPTLGQQCRVSNSPQNTTVFYPDMQIVHLTNFYYMLCPCEEGLVCSEKTSTCEENGVHNLIERW